MAISIKSDREIELMTIAGNIVYETHKYLKEYPDVANANITVGNSTAGLSLLAMGGIYQLPDGAGSTGLYYFDNLGCMGTGLQEYAGAYYYFDTTTGKMATGWQLVGGQSIYFGADGKMLFNIGNVQDDTLKENFQQSLDNLGINNANEFELINKKHEARQIPKIVNEKMDVSQGNLIIGLDVNSDKSTEEIMMYNAVLGTGANSKLFQNVREKASLAYSAGSRYYRRKDMIMIRTGIEIANYDKALTIIKKQLQDIKEGIVSVQEMESAKQFIVSTLKLIPESSESLINYYYDKEIRGEEADLEAYIKAIQEVQIQDIVDVAQDVLIDTIYFLRD